MKKVVLYQLPPLVWILCCFVLAYFPGFFFGATVSMGLIRIVHAGSYFVLCWLVQRAFIHQEYLPQLKQHSLLGSFIFSCVYGLLDEYNQDFLPDHSPNIYNLLAAIGGALLFVALMSMVSAGRTGSGSEREG